jgi:hypothetical protein
MSNGDVFSSACSSWRGVQTSGLLTILADALLARPAAI